MPELPTSKWTLDRIINILLYLGGIVLFLALLDYLSPYLTSFFVALLVAYILEPIVSFFQTRLKLKRRWLAVIATFLLIFGSLSLLLAITLPAVSSEFSKLQGLMEESPLLHIEDLLPEGLQEEIEAYLYSEEVKELLTEENLAGYGTKLLSYIWGALSSAMGLVLGLFSLITFFLYLVFIMLFYDDFSKNWKRSIPPAYRQGAVTLIQDVEAGMQVYFRGQALVVFWVCILFATGFKIIGLPLGILLGIVVGLLNFVPYLQTLGLLPGLLLAGAQALETGQEFWLCATLVLVVFAVVQGIQEVLLVPRILGNATGLNPAVILLALSVWGGLFEMC